MSHEPGQCRSDRCAPCVYWHLKRRAAAGYRLTQAELDFVGYYEPRRVPADGWHAIGVTPDPEDAWVQDLRGLRYILEIGGMRQELSV